MKLTKASVPNIITMFRLAGTVCLLVLVPFTAPFYLVYTLCGISDVLDGAVARATGTSSELGARLDSIADISFYAVMIVRIFPALWKRLPEAVWYVVGAAVLIRIASYALAAVKYHRFASLHTYLNKVTGFLVFCVPYSLLTVAAVPFCYTVAGVATLSGTEELIIHLRQKEYDSHIKSIRMLPVKCEEV